MSRPVRQRTDRAPHRARGAPATADLAAILRAHLGDRRISTVIRRPSRYRTSFPLEEVDVWLDDGTALRLLFKDLAIDGLGSARRAKPSFLLDAAREVLVYRDVLDPVRWGTARCHGTALDRRRGRYWLLIERVDGVELYQCGAIDTWKHVSQWLAAFHAGMAHEIAEEAARAAHLLIHDAMYYRRWRRRAEQLLPRGTPAHAPVPRSVASWLLERYDAATDLLLTQPRTLVHGELYASNVLVNEHSGRVCPVDWEVAALAPALTDLGAFVSGGWNESERADLTQAYFGAAATVDQLQILRCCQLHIAIQWLARSPDWRPPTEHRHDWLADAVRLAEETGP